MNTFAVCAWIAEINVKIIAQRGISAENEINWMFVDSCQRQIKSMLGLRGVFVRNTCEYVPFHFTVIKTAALTLASRSTSVSYLHVFLFMFNVEESIKSSLCRKTEVLAYASHIFWHST